MYFAPSQLPFVVILALVCYTIGGKSHHMSYDWRCITLTWKDLTPIQRIYAYHNDIETPSAAATPDESETWFYSLAGKEDYAILKRALKLSNGQDGINICIKNAQIARLLYMVEDGKREYKSNDQRAMCRFETLKRRGWFCGENYLHFHITFDGLLASNNAPQ